MKYASNNEQEMKTHKKLKEVIKWIEDFFAFQ